MKTTYKNIAKTVGILLIGLLLGWMLFGGNNSEKDSHNHETEQTENTFWTCSMHPQIKQPEAGKCPLCGMDLIPLENNNSGADPNSIVMSENALKLANIQTMVVGSGAVSKEIRLNGKVQFDERKTVAQTTHIPGRIERLTINFTGEKVSKGQTIAVVYSPELVTAQDELLQANAIKNSQPALFEAAKQKLRNWKISESTISKIISSGKPIQQFPITADASGIVITKKVNLGDYVERGMPLYEIADVSSLWVLFDVYERELNWIKVGDKISYNIQSNPSETFEGTISFLDPIINPETRVSTARVEVKNVNNQLKPEMFVTGVLKNNASATTSTEMIVPKSAVMWTGERSIVYVKNSDASNVSFQLRNVTLGISTGDSYVIKDGLSSGEEIVINGTFTVDAAAQLAGKPSMMNANGGKVSTGHENHIGMQETTVEKSIQSIEKIKISEKFQQQLKAVFESYILLKNNLVNDNALLTQKEASNVLKTLKKVDMKLLTTDDSHKKWMEIEKEIAKFSTVISSTSEIKKQRDYFIDLSKSISKSIEIFGINKKVYQQFCPMANSDKGAIWLSSEEKIMNPYFGSSMLSCGTVQKIIK